MRSAYEFGKEKNREYDFEKLGMTFGKKIFSKNSTTENTMKLFWELWNKISDIGFFEMIIPQKYGGMGLKIGQIVDFTMGLGYGADSIENLFSVNVQMWACIAPILKFGSEDLIKNNILKLTKPQYICAHAISEEISGSDVFNMETKYEKRGDYYYITGNKRYVTNAPVANCFIVYARDCNDMTRKMPQITCFYIEKDSGIKVGQEIKKMGMDLSPMANIYFNECKVSPQNIIGKINQGSIIFNYTMALERTFLLAYQIGIMKRQLDDNVYYTKSRKQGGKKIIDYQAVSNRLAHMKVNLEASKLFLQKMVRKIENEEDIFLDSSIAKLFVSNAIVDNSMNAMKNYGTLGYTKDINVERQLRDALGSQFYSGTTDIQQNIISALL